MELTIEERTELFDEVELFTAKLMTTMLLNINHKNIELGVRRKLIEEFPQIPNKNVVKIAGKNKIRRDSIDNVVKNVKVFERVEYNKVVKDIRSNDYRDFRKFIFANGLHTVYQEISGEICNLHTTRIDK